MINPFLWWADVLKTDYELKYFPAKAEKGYPFALICPGGGYRCVMSCVEGVPIAKALNELSCPAFVLRYRVREKGRLPAPMDDLARAIREIMDGNDIRWKINMQGYSVWGFSAGGHLFQQFPTGKHGCGLGKGRVCEPWFDMAVRFWRDTAERDLTK